MARRAAAALSPIPRGRWRRRWRSSSGRTAARGWRGSPALADELGAERVVVGLPLTLAGEEGEQAGEARAFAESLERRVQVPVDLYDERLTTRMAAATGGRADEDSIAAAHLLESYLAAQAAAHERRRPFAEERERARLEREASARRSAARRRRRGRPHADAEPAPEPTPVPERAVRARRAEPEPAATEARPPEPPLRSSRARRAGRPAFRARGASASERRAAAREFLHGRRGGGGRAGAPTRRRAATSRGPRVAIVAVAGGLVVLAVAWFLLSLFQPLKGDGSGEVVGDDPARSEHGEIARHPRAEGVISSAFFFRCADDALRQRRRLQGRRVPMREDMSYGAAIDALTTRPKPDTVTITIPEGLSRPEIKRLVGDSLRGDYMRRRRSARRG